MRALRHALERAVILSDGETLRIGDFPLQPADGEGRGGEDGGLSGTLAEVERRAIEQALQRHAGNVTHAAHDLGITRTSLYRRMEKYGL